jgi:DNA repair protein RadA/Sms
MYSQKVDSVPGSIGQIREATMRFLTYSKEKNACTFLIGHITKDGALAGPKSLEHIVDVVLYFEGDRHHNQKLIRTVKNRFGPSNEIGIFEMTAGGLKPVENASRLFLTERAQDSSGSAVLSAIQGSRPILVELQALVSDSNFSTARRTANGVDSNRLALLLAMLEKRIGLQLLRSDVYINVAGGIIINEPAVDLAIVGAVVSSFRNSPISSDLVLFGEVGLAGEVRSVSFASARVRESASLGFDTIIMPKGNLPLSEAPEEVRLIGISSVGEALRVLGF